MNQQQTCYADFECLDGKMNKILTFDPDCHVRHISMTFYHVLLGMPKHGETTAATILPIVSWSGINILCCGPWGVHQYILLVKWTRASS